MLLMKRNQEPTISDFVSQFFNNELANRMEDGFNVLRPKANIKENEKSYEIEMQVPGFDKKDFAIEVEDNTLKVSAKVEDKKEEKDKKGQIIHEEYISKSIERNFQLSNIVDSSKIAAKYKNGILHINVPKKEDAVVKKMIEIS